jgi:hypothetical protein
MRCNFIARLAHTMANNHVACVDAWITRRIEDPHSGLVDAFDETLDRLRLRAGATLSDITLVAILDRVVVNTGKKYPNFGGLSVEANGRIVVGSLRDPSIDRATLIAGMRFALVELLTVVGNLTAEILTPALHEQLSRESPGGGRSS